MEGITVGVLSDDVTSVHKSFEQCSGTWHNIQAGDMLFEKVPNDDDDDAVTAAAAAADDDDGDDGDVSCDVMVPMVTVGIGDHEAVSIGRQLKSPNDGAWPTDVIGGANDVIASAVRQGMATEQSARKSGAGLRF